MAEQQRGVIHAPLTGLAEIDPLVAAGAESFYLGFNPAISSDLASVNRRSFAAAQFSDSREFTAAIKTLVRQGLGAAVVLNAQVYSSYLPAMEVVELALGAGGREFVVSDPGLIIRLSQSYPAAKITISSLAVVRNSEAVSFFVRLGASRIILARHLPLGSIEKLQARHKNVQFECFALVGKCANIEGLCTFLHDNQQRVWPCVAKYRASPPFFAWDRWSDSRRSDACGLCALYQLWEAGVERWKLVGRGLPLERKLELVQALVAARDLIRRGEGKANYLVWARSYRQQLFAHSECSEQHCYYPFDFFADTIDRGESNI